MAPTTLQTAVVDGSAAEAAPPERGPGAPPADRPAHRDFMRLIPRDFAREHLVLGVSGDSGELIVLAGPGTLPAVVHNTLARLPAPAPVMTAEAEPLARAIDAAYIAFAGADGPSGWPGAGPNSEPDGATAPSGGADELNRLIAVADRDLLATSGKGVIVRLVDAILFEALGLGASDVHVQPMADRTLVRYRLDGVLRTARELPAALNAPVVGRIKVMGGMDIAESRVPQDGRATVTIGAGPHARSIDLRLSSLPTNRGERAVLRLLETGRGAHLAGFDGLGMPPEVRDDYLDRAGRSSGLILVTGPTGSGKTTTLYATMRHVALTTAAGLNIMTVEDPIEYELSSIGLPISQSTVNARKGVTFATGLRHILRQDPDVMMVGEIRDAETARVAVQASLTGHLVFSTLHTADAASAATRLIDLGVEAYLVSASLSAVLAQRLVRLTHGECGGAGCPGCLRSGFRGRTAVFELMVVGDALRSMIMAGAAASALRSAAVAAGMRTLAAEGERLVGTGRTSAAEVRRVVMGAGE